MFNTFYGLPIGEQCREAKPNEFQHASEARARGKETRVKDRVTYFQFRLVLLRLRVHCSDVHGS